MEIYKRGYLFISEDLFKSKDEDLNKYFSNIKNEEDLKDLLRNSNGFFALILETEDYTFATVDRIRSIPIFYGFKDEEFFISDNAYEIKGKVKDGIIDEDAKSEMLYTGYVTGNNTLYKDIKQIRAGEYLIFDKKSNELKLERYFEFRHRNFYELPKEELIEKLDKVHENLTKRLIKSLGGGRLFYPLVVDKIQGLLQ